jgi:hypothetical protein
MSLTLTKFSWGERNGDVNLTFDKILTTLAISDGRKKHHCSHPYVGKFHVNI